MWRRAVALARWGLVGKFQAARGFRVSTVRRECGGTARVRYIRALRAAEEAYSIKNKRLGRPLSPALSIYKKQLTTVLSITNRLSAIYLSTQLAAAGLACLWACRKKAKFEDLMQRIESWKLENTGIYAMKLMLVLPFVYHMCLGIRHLLWDSGRFLTIPQVYRTGYVALLAFVLISLALAGYGIRKQQPPPNKRPRM
ncbi:succinate dehydrogenase cytochrome b560 subunit, mitochondrial-like [Ctenocephalides felis]|uniref:succinate dehydrogenase cytochrome b560 subunit, mitochondrial-like n=1 Tax=Ctenocephalides felis TaxID=7515 RepID=UPI000E6E35D3|nr:succinate dehydrogenase cytochrome b560 subunit, mitochondrial-like [Ctenocephalides felis]